MAPFGIADAERNRRMVLGLGLSIARGSAAFIDAKTIATSRPGQGSKFGFEQPQAREITMIEPDGADPARGQPLKRRAYLPLLIVDDDHDVRATISDLLRRWGMRF